MREEYFLRILMNGLVKNGKCGDSVNARFANIKSLSG